MASSRSEANKNLLITSRTRNSGNVMNRRTGVQSACVLFSENIGSNDRDVSHLLQNTLFDLTSCRRNVSDDGRLSGWQDQIYSDKTASINDYTKDKLLKTHNSNTHKKRYLSLLFQVCQLKD